MTEDGYENLSAGAPRKVTERTPNRIRPLIGDADLGNRRRELGRIRVALGRARGSERKKRGDDLRLITVQANGIVHDALRVGRMIDLAEAMMEALARIGLASPVSPPDPMETQA